MTITVPPAWLAVLILLGATLFATLSIATVKLITSSWHKATGRRQEWLHARRNRPTIRVRWGWPIWIERDR